MPLYRTGTETNVTKYIQLKGFIVLTKATDPNQSLAFTQTIACPSTEEQVGTTLTGITTGAAQTMTIHYTSVSFVDKSQVENTFNEALEKAIAYSKK